MSIVTMVCLIVQAVIIHLSFYRALTRRKWPEFALLAAHISVFAILIINSIKP